jgi:hypothetical protein
MSTPGVWRFDTPDGAGNAVSTLGDLSRQQLITVHDAATRVLAAGREEAEDPLSAPAPVRSCSWRRARRAALHEPVPGAGGHSA